MTDILSFIESKLRKININYEFGEWERPIVYPYFVGSFNETEYRYEDGYTGGIFTLDGWSRNSLLDLTTASDRIREVFQDAYECVERPWKWDPLNLNYGKIKNTTSTFFVRFGSSFPVPSGEEGLYKVTITLFTSEWEED